MEHLTSLLNSATKFPENDTFTNYMGALIDQTSGFDSNDPGTKRRRYLCIYARDQVTVIIKINFALIYDINLVIFLQQFKIHQT